MYKPSFERINQGYLDTFKKFGDSAAAVQIPRDNQSVRFESVVRFLQDSDQQVLSIADFGCGLGHLNEYLKKNFKGNFHYTGIDINQDFLDYNKSKQTEANFLEREEFFSSPDNYDIITSVGTFNGLYEDDSLKHKEFVYSEIAELWRKTRISLHINFMSTVVDFVQVGAYHQDVGELYDFVCRNISRKLLVDSLYLPYEFSIIIWKD